MHCHFWRWVLREEHLKQQEDQKEVAALGSRADIEKALEQLEQRKRKYELMEEQVDLSDDGQVSTSDKESRALIQHHNVVEVSYNSQAAVDDWIFRWCWFSLTFDEMSIFGIMRPGQLVYKAPSFLVYIPVEKYTKIQLKSIPVVIA